LGARLVLYFYPGAVCSPEDGYQSPLRDSVQHRAFANRDAELVGLGYAIVGVSSQSLEVQRRVIADTGVRHTLLSDPDLVLAQTLGLPTFRLDQAEWYRRLVVVMEEDRIVAVFYPATNTPGAASQAVAWIRGSGEQVA
jgi:peroxiredoxin